ncbi:MAG: transposase [Chloroflexota bacterium]|nr:transposase [Chloroflexota bacterium]
MPSYSSIFDAFALGVPEPSVAPHSRRAAADLGWLTRASGASKDFLRASAAKRIHLEKLPGYAPDLNPTEGIWPYLKYVVMKNLCCPTMLQLRHELRKAIARLRHKTKVICAGIDRIHLGQAL